MIIIHETYQHVKFIASMRIEILSSIIKQCALANVLKNKTHACCHSLLEEALALRIFPVLGSQHETKIFSFT